MCNIQLLQLAVHINSPWVIAAVDFDAAVKRLDIEADFMAGSRFACSECGRAEFPVHDTMHSNWRDLDFFQYPAVVDARTRRSTCATYVDRDHVKWSGC